MVWYRVDDDFHDHPKTWDLSDAAVALWTRAGSWAAGHLTDGTVTRDMCARWCSEPDKAIAELCGHGLWSVTRDSVFTFHDWGDYNPLRAEVENDREQAKLRQQRSRAKRKVSRVTPPETSRRDTANVSRVSHSAPTRPDPSLKDGAGEGTRTDGGRPAPRRQPAPSGTGGAAPAAQCPVCGKPHPLRDCPVQRSYDPATAPPPLPYGPAPETAEHGAKAARDLLATRPPTTHTEAPAAIDPQARARAQVAASRASHPAPPPADPDEDYTPPF